MTRPTRLFRISRLIPATLLALLLAIALGRLPVHAQTVTVSASESPVRMTQETIAIDIGGGMAATTIDMVFHNPGDRILEAPLLIPLEPGQRVIGFALDIDGAMRDAVPVEKTRGRQVFEAIERRGVDPGLLEATGDNAFRMRLYPIPARGERHVRLRLAQALARTDDAWTYRLPLFGHMDGITLKASLRVHGAGAAPTLPDSPVPVDFQPDGDALAAELPRAALAGRGLTVTGRLDAAPRAWTGESGDESYFYAELPVSDAARPRTLARTVGLLWDSSGSGATRRHDLEFALLERYFRAAGDVEVRLVRLRDRAEAPRSFTVRGGDWSALRRELERTAYDGATAFGGWSPERRVGEYLLFSDGRENYGPRGFPKLDPAQRLFAVDAADGGDDVRLDALAQRHGGRLIHPLPGALDAAAQALLSDPVRIAALEGDGLDELQAASNEASNGVLRIAGRRLRSDALLRVRLGDGRALDVVVDARSPRQPLAPLLWAGWRIDALQADGDLQRGAIARLSRRFGIATRESSLIVLERLDDYVRYDIEPPPGLRPAYERMRAARLGQQDNARATHLQRVLRELDDKLAWWKTRYPKDKPAQDGQNGAEADYAGKSGPIMFAPPPPQPAAPARPLPYAPPPLSTEIRRAPPMPDAAPMPIPAPIAPPPPASFVMQRAPTRAGTAAPAPQQSVVLPAGIALQKWTPDEAYLDRMAHLDAAQVYAIYLDEKPDHANSTAFYLDVADLLFDKGARDLALRVLSNLAEMDLDNRQVLRVLGARLIQAGAPALAVPVYEQVRQLAPDEPQSWRDLGLAYAAVKRAQDAVDTLYQVAVRPWDARFPEVELIALADLNAIVAGHTKVDTSRMDARLLRPMPLDLRAVLSWDADNTDMDLWVTDPNGERCMYSNRLTYQGGRMSRDVTQGYGPEEFSLRDAKPGKYKVEVNFYGHRQALLSSSTTLQLRLTTGFGTALAQERMVTLRLRGRGETVLVGEFEVPAAGR